LACAVCPEVYSAFSPRSRHHRRVRAIATGSSALCFGGRRFGGTRYAWVRCAV
jgi:hypothetical protein